MKFPQLKDFFELTNDDEILNFNQTRFGQSILIYAFEHNFYLKFSKEQFDYLIDNIDLNLLDNNYLNILFYSINNNDLVNFTDEQYKKLILNSDLNKFKEHNLFLLYLIKDGFKLNFENEMLLYNKYCHDFERFKPFSNDLQKSFDDFMFRKKTFEEKEILNNLLADVNNNNLKNYKI